MTPSQAVAQLELWLRVDNGIVPPAVLHDDGGELSVGVEDIQPSVAQLHLHLLVGVANVDIGVIGDVHGNTHARLHHHETGDEHGRLIVVVLVVDRNAVVAAHLQSAALVGNLQLVVGVEHIGVDGLLQVVEWLCVVEAVDVVGGEDIFRHRPIAFTMFHAVDVAMVLMGEVVEADDDGHASAQGDDGL